MKYIITGSSGFLGSHICHELELYGNEVVGLDLQLSRFHDLRFPEIVDTLFTENADADVCIHLAAKVGRLFGEDNPMETITDNVGMTALVAQACGAHKIRMVYASTSEVYGDNGTAVCDEYDGPFSLPHNVYGISKYFGEDICEHYAPDDLTIFRFSMPYGPGLPAGRGRAAIINMLWQAKRRERIPVHRGAERSWCWIGDTVRATRLAIEDWNAGVYNIGRDDAAVSMMKVARLACLLTGSDHTLIREVDAPANQTVVKRLSTKRIRSLGWEPEVELRDGMERTLAWVEQLGDDGMPREDWFNDRVLT
jgi:nucleoside-diphosphate-sugar epimerase